ncbi:MAG TPA: LmeA family phospholipid-binding protein [Ornithinibacter sp.]|nr:LmeA family phospholipid-binding protein [Ornithinibacter sp.]
MKRFLLGVGTTLAVLVVGVFVLLLVLGSGGGGPGAVPSPTASGPAPQPPDDLTPEETWLSSVQLRSADVVASGTGVRFSPTGLRAQRLDLDATVPFATVAAEVGQDVRIFPAEGGRAGIERTVSLLGREVTVRATGTVEADAGQLLIEPETIDLGGPAFLDTTASALARRLVTIRQDVAGVPEGMSLTAVEVTDAGFAASLTGTDVTISR